MTGRRPERIALITYMVLDGTGIYEGSNLLLYVYGIAEALIYVTVLMFPLYTTGLLSKIRIKRTRSKKIMLPDPALKIIGFIVAFVVAAFIRIIISKVFR